MYLEVLAVLVCVLMSRGHADVLDLGPDPVRELKEVSSKKSEPYIEYVDNDPEFLVGVRGIEKPLCFNTEGEPDQVVRLLQDPVAGVIVNARLFYDALTNKTYLGAILISRGNFRLLAKQRYVMVNEARFDWDDVTALSVDGHRVVVGNDIAAVTFRRRQITLLIKRHFAHPDEFDYSVLDRVRETTPRAPIPSTDVYPEGESNARTPDRADIMPVIAYEERSQVINHFLSSKRRRSLILQNFFGIDQDSAVVRNLMVEVDSEGRKKRHMNSEDGTKQHLEEQRQQQQQQMWRPTHRRRHEIGRRARDLNDDATTDSGPSRRDRTIFLGVYIADSRDLSNSTHGLLGQFLFKNVTLERIRYKNGRMKALLRVLGEPERKTIATLTLRRNMALNATRACWKIRRQGSEVIDGSYSDYLVPSVRYNNLKELPPPTPS